MRCGLNSAVKHYNNNAIYGLFILYFVFYGQSSVYLSVICIACMKISIDSVEIFHANAYTVDRSCTNMDKISFNSYFVNINGNGSKQLIL